MHLRMIALISRLVGQMSLRKTFLPFLSMPSGCLATIDVHRAGERVGDDQRRRGEIVRAHVGVDAAFEIAIARQHRGGDQIVLVDRLGDLLRQRTGIADAGGAAEADQIEAERVEILLQAGLLVDSRATTCEPGASEVFTHGFTVRPLATAFRASRPAADHHARDSRCWCRR